MGRCEHVSRSWCDGQGHLRPRRNAAPRGRSLRDDCLRPRRRERIGDDVAERAARPARALREPRRTTGRRRQARSPPAVRCSRRDRCASTARPAVPTAGSSLEHRAARGLDSPARVTSPTSSPALSIASCGDRLREPDHGRHLQLSLAGAHIEHDLGAARLRCARRRRLREHGGLRRELDEAFLALSSP